MNVRPIQNFPAYSFKGYDARPLKGVVMRSADQDDGHILLAEELDDIGKKNGFNVYLQDQNSIYTKDFSKLFKNNRFPREYLWTQDSLTFLPDKKMSTGWIEPYNNIDGYKFSKNDIKLAHFLNNRLAKVHQDKNKNLLDHIEGGNYFIVKDGKKETVLIGDEEGFVYSYDEIKKILNVERVFYVPQGDFHIDLIIRPLKNGTVLVADDELTLKIFDEGIQKAEKHLEKYDDDDISDARDELIHHKRAFEDNISNNTYDASTKVKETLKEYGFNVVSVPGRIYTADKNNRNVLRHRTNYMNAIVHEKQDNSLVYITNKSNFDSKIGLSERVIEKLDFSFEKAFVESIKDYVEPKNIHFVSGDGYLSSSLQNTNGGVHCYCAEIPKMD